MIDATQIKLEGRAPINEVYDFIYSDLTNAIAKFTSSGRTTTASFANKTAAQALFSRVALYRGDWTNSAKYATDAMATGSIGRFQTTANYVASWRSANQPESIFEIQYQTNENIGVIHLCKLPALLWLHQVTVLELVDLET